MTEEIEPTPETPTGRPLVVRVAQLSDVGRVRAENQDFAILSAPADEVDHLAPTEDAVHRLRATAVEQARRAALGRGVLCDQSGRQGEVEVGEGVDGHVMQAVPA